MRNENKQSKILKGIILKNNRFLIIRTDRIGDVILTTPVATAIKRSVAGSHVTLMCRQETAIIGERNPDVDDIITIDEDGRSRSFFELVKILKSGNYGCAIIVHPTFSLAVLTAAARIPLRVGTGYRFYSRFFTNRRYEHRQESVKHEAEYNLGLLEELNISKSNPEFKFHFTDSDKMAADNTLKELGLHKDDRYCMVHPGSGGSAMDWPLRFYAVASDLISSEFDIPVLISWGTAEKNLAKELVMQSRKNVIALPGVLSLPALAAMLCKAEFLLAPSTGILHLGHIVGTEVIGLYPPTPHESPVRWGPFGKEDKMLVPDKDKCPDCEGKNCRKLSCLELITPDQVLNAARKIFNEIDAKKKLSIV